MLDIDPLRDGVTPLPAATVVVLRAAPVGLEVFLVQRTKGAAFMGGAYVFPGGKLDPTDVAASVLARADGLDAAEAARRMGEDDGERALGLHVAAVRETLEEAGVLVGRSRRGVDAAEVRARLLGGVPFATLCDELDLALAVDRLVPLARWVTPTVERRRFDARFFLCEVPASTSASHDAGETVAGAWMTPTVAIERHVRGEIDLPPPTLRTLENLLPFASVGDALNAARTRRPPVVQPVFRDLSGQWVLALPGDVEHPEKEPVLPGATRFSATNARWFSG